MALPVAAKLATGIPLPCPGFAPHVSGRGKYSGSSLERCTEYTSHHLLSGRQSSSTVRSPARTASVVSGVACARRAIWVPTEPWCCVWQSSAGREGGTEGGGSALPSGGYTRRGLPAMPRDNEPRDLNRAPGNRRAQTYPRSSICDVALQVSASRMSSRGWCVGTQTRGCGLPRA